MTPFVLCWAAVAGLISGGCVSTSVYQSGKTLKAGHWQSGLGFGVAHFTAKSKIVDFDTELGFPAVDFWLRYGITDFVDIGSKISLPGSASADLKLGLLSEDRGHPISLAVGGGYAQASNSSTTGSREDKTTISDSMAPVYLSKDFGEVLTLYAVPRLIARTTKNTRIQSGVQTKESFNDQMLGLGGGVMFNLGIGRDKHMAFEYHKLTDTDESEHSSTQAGFAIFFEF
ncbi:MAG: hypothetical protein HY547_04500 [Elusimicrobia bacterium]|nr:hypothetical protein [Elusimicrobiota bacterium]